MKPKLHDLLTPIVSDKPPVALDYKLIGVCRKEGKCVCGLCQAIGIKLPPKQLSIFGENE